MYTLLLRTGGIKMKKKWIILITAVLFALISTGFVKWKKDSMVQELAEEVLRFHVLANSDSEEDQLLKMQVKEAVIAYMQGAIPQVDSVEETTRWAANNLDKLEEIAAGIVQEEGYQYPVVAKVIRDEFPEKSYGDVTFPAGYYNALRIEIGDARGQNWWCVLYPNLCFVDAVHAVVPEEGKQELQNVLEEDTYQMITNPPKWKLSWFFF